MKTLIFSLAFTLAFGAIAIAQPTTLPETPPNANGPSAIPVDGGASLLLVSGAVMGLKRLNKKK